MTADSITSPEPAQIPEPSSPSADLEAVEFCRASYHQVQQEIAKVVVGQTQVVEEILLAILTRSHALLVGVPGLAKTLLISTLAKTLQMSFKRIQFTPDLMPSDITGTEVIYQDPVSGAKEFKFLPGPLFVNIVLADEINRTPPKTQAAMLEAMQERRVTVGGTTHRLPDPFFVLVTQNPLEQEGTYPLPEAQLDRFMFLVQVDYPSEEEELLVMKMGTGLKGEEPQPVLSAEHILYMQETVKAVPVADHVYRYAEKLVRSTRPKTDGSLDYCRKFLNFGAGPRASLSLIMAAKAHAMVAGQVYVGCENVAAVAPSILRHRIAPNFAAQSEGVSSDDIVTHLLQTIPQHQPHHQVMADISLLDPEAVSRGEALGLMARRIVEGYRVGEHRSPFRGFAIEFSQHREYTAGDDIRHLDWKVLGRSDRYYIKQYEQDTNYVAHVVLDGSRSMEYGSGNTTKLQFGKALAACLAYLILLQRDAVALAIFDTETREYLPRTDSLGKIHHIMNRLAAFESAEGTGIGKAVEQLATRARSRGIVILVTDVFDDEEGFVRALQLLNYSRHEVIVFHVLDPYELTFPFTGTWKLQGLEEAEEIQTSPADIRRSYLENFNAFQERVRAACEKFNTHYVLADTGKSLAEILSGYLAFRRMMGRK